MNRILKFAVIGVANTATDFTIYSGLVLLTSCNPILAHVVSYSCGIFSSFIGNSCYTFREQSSAIDDVRIRFATYYAANLVGLLFASTVLGLMTLWFDPLVAKALSIPPTILFNFTVARRVLASSCDGVGRGAATAEMR